jgi:RNA polymerase sigma factor (sigma-70 family)
MVNTLTPPARSGHRPYVMAMVLGTALTALGSQALHAADCPEATERAVGDLSRYCTVCWRNARLPPDSWSDCTQEVFRRLLERVKPDAWDQALKGEGEERREFLRAIDAVKKRTQRSRKWSPGLVEPAADERDQQRQQVAEQREAVRRASTELLSTRQQQIMQLSFDGWSVHEIAEKMALPAERVSDEKYKAIRKLHNRLAPAI